MTFTFLIMSKRVTIPHCELKDTNSEYLKIKTTQQTKIIREDIESASQKLDKVVSLLE
jgi:hypothetical protein